MKHTRLPAIGLLALTVAACGGGAGHTVPVRTIVMNSELAATLAATDPQLAEHGSYHMYTFTSTAGQNVQIDLLSSEFDAFVTLQDSRGTVLASANDGGDGNNARITFVLREDGTYKITATSNRAGELGNYRVRLGTLGGVRMLTIGRPASGQLQPSDQRLPDNFLYHSYSFNARAAQAVTIDAGASAFDPYLMILDAGGTRIASDDDSGEGRNPRLTFTFPYEGTYRILIGSYTANATGAYSLSIR